jgi:protein-S-isoprenylcysteine O-methyltransferase Ste14
VVGERQLIFVLQGREMTTYMRMEQNKSHEQLVVVGKVVVMFVVILSFLATLHTNMYSLSCVPAQSCGKIHDFSRNAAVYLRSIKD